MAARGETLECSYSALDRAAPLQPSYLCLQRSYTNSTDLGAVVSLTCTCYNYVTVIDLSRSLPLCIPSLKTASKQLPKAPCGLAPWGLESVTDRQTDGNWKLLGNIYKR